MEEAAKIRHSYRLKNKLKHELNKKKSENAVKNADQMMNVKTGEYHFN